MVWGEEEKLTVCLTPVEEAARVNALLISRGVGEATAHRVVVWPSSRELGIDELGIVIRTEVGETKYSTLPA